MADREESIWAGKNGDAVDGGDNGRLVFIGRILVMLFKSVVLYVMNAVLSMP